jgi:hypothetical protein
VELKQNPGTGTATNLKRNKNQRGIMLIMPIIPSKFQI